MRPMRLLSAFAVILFAASSVAAQEKPGTLAVLELQKPKNGMLNQYEDGRKRKADWHKQQRDPQPLLVWEVLSGDSTGSYIVGRLDKRWSDFDKPAVSAHAEGEEFQKVVGNYTDSVVARYYDSMPTISNPNSSGRPAKLDQVITFHVRYGKESDFRTAIGRIYDAAQMTKSPIHYEWYLLRAGGDQGTYVVILACAHWSDLEDKIGMNPFHEMLKNAFGRAEADSIVARIETSVQSETSEIVQFRPDLSDLPE